jgi:hypothetical protein
VGGNLLLVTLLCFSFSCKTHIVRLSFFLIFHQSEGVFPTDTLVIVIRDDFALSSALFQGYFYGEAEIPLSTLKNNQDIEEWYSLKKRKGTTHEGTVSS